MSRCWHIVQQRLSCKNGVSCLLVMLLLTYQCFCFASPLRGNGVYTPLDYGVVHLGPLSGEIESTSGGEKRIALAFTYMKVLQDAVAGGYLLRGHVWLLDPVNPVHERSIWSYNPAIHFYNGEYKRPTFQLTSATNGMPEDGIPQTRINFTVLDETYIAQLHDGRRVMPYVIEITLPQNSLTDGIFTINNWIYKAYVGDLSLVASKDERNEPLSIWAIQKPAFRSGAYHTAHVLDAFTHHCFRLGMNGTVQYERGTYLKVLLDHPSIKRLIRLGRLSFMWWDHSTAGFPTAGADSNIKRPIHDQYLVNNHAALAFMYSNSYLFFGDYDDILIVSQPPSHFPLREMLTSGNGCLHAEKLIGIGRYEYLCRKSDKPLSHSNLYGKHDKVPDSSLRVGPRFVCEDSDSWFSKKGEPMIAHGYGLDKVLAHADTLRYMGVHAGFLYKDVASREGIPAAKKMVNSSCLYVAHMHNLVDLVMKEDPRDLHVNHQPGQNLREGMSN